MSRAQTPPPKSRWITRRVAAGTSLLLVSTLVVALLYPQPTAWIALPGAEGSTGTRTSTLDRVQFNCITRELRGRVTLTGLDVTEGLRVETFDAVLIDEVTLQPMSVAATVRLTRAQSADGDRIVLEGRLARVPDGLYPAGVDAQISYLGSNRERQHAGLRSSMWVQGRVDDEAVAGFVAEGAGAVAELLSRCASDDAADRETAVVALGLIRADAKRVVPRLRERLSDPHTSVRSSAIHALGQFGVEAQPAVTDLASMLRRSDTYASLRRDALWALRAIGPAASQAVPVLIDQVRGDAPLDRLLALKALGSIGPSARAAQSALVALQQQTIHCDNTRTALTEALLRIGGAVPDTVPPDTVPGE